MRAGKQEKYNTEDNSAHFYVTNLGVSSDLMIREQKNNQSFY